MEFVPLAEETGLIVPLGVWALEEACRQAVALARGDARRAASSSMSVNLSPRQLAEPALPNDVARVLHETGIHPSALWLEITESTLMRDAESALSALGALRALGLHLAVDDFGTGYSSLAYLERLPVEALKIDRSFIAGVGARKDSTAIVDAIVSLARALRLSTVAEGIETREQFRQLRGMGCEIGQGYLFGPPQSAAGVRARPLPGIRAHLQRRSRRRGVALVARLTHSHLLHVLPPSPVSSAPARRPSLRPLAHILLAAFLNGGADASLRPSMHEKVIVVTGAAQGIGETYARRFAAEGAHVRARRCEPREGGRSRGRDPG